MYIINEWAERYEVNAAGRAAKPGDELKKTDLAYIRLAVHGRRVSVGFEAVQELAGEKAFEVLGIFDLFLQIAAVGRPEQRGQLRDHKDRPATIAALCRQTRATEDQINHAICILSDPEIAWISEIPDIYADARGNPQGPAEDCGRPQQPADNSAVKRPDADFPADNEDTRKPAESRGQAGTFANALIKSNPNTNLKLNLNTSQKEPAERPDSGLVFKSSFQELDSELPAPAGGTNRQSFYLKINEVLNIKAPAEQTTFNNLADFLADQAAEDPGIFDRALNLAADCINKKSVKNPRAYFISLCKDNFGFVKSVEWHSRRARQKAGQV